MKSVMLAAAILVSAAAAEETTPSFDLVIKDHVFAPATLEIPAGVKVQIVVKNQDATPEEFESYDLNREKVIPGNSEATIFIGPLDAGSYEFAGEFHEDTAQGTIVAK